MSEKYICIYNIVEKKMVKFRYEMVKLGDANTHYMNAAVEALAAEG